MHVESDFDFVPHGLTHRFKCFHRVAHRPRRFENVTRIGRQTEPHHFKAFIHARLGGLRKGLRAVGAAAEMRVATHLVAGLAAEQLVSWDFERLTCQVPQSDVEGGNRRCEHRARAPEVAAKVVLPDVLDA